MRWYQVDIDIDCSLGLMPLCELMSHYEKCQISDGKGNDTAINSVQLNIQCIGVFHTFGIFFCISCISMHYMALVRREIP